MTPESHSKIIQALESFHPDQPFTVEELVRKIGEAQGEGWAGVFEVEAAANLENYLLEKNLLKKFGTITTYRKSVKHGISN